MSSEEQAEVIRYFAPGTQKKWGEGQYTVLRVQSTFLKYPEFRERFKKEPDPVAQATQEVQAEKDFVYAGEIHAKQLPYLRRWAAERGARVEATAATSTAEGIIWQYRITSKADLLERQRIQRDIERELFRPTPMQEAIGGFTPTEQLVTRVPSVAAIEHKEREAFIQKKAAEKVKEEGAAARIRTLLSPEGVEYIGAVALGKDPTTIVQKKIEREYRLQLIDKSPEEKYVRSAVETLLSPPMEVTLAFAGGVGFAKIGATKIGTKILATKAAKGVLAAGAVYYVGTTGLEAYTDISMGQVERGVGRIITTGAALGAGLVGAKLAAREMAKIPTRVDVEIKPAKTKGMSISTAETKTDPARMAGVFETKIQVGKKEIPVKGLIIGVSKAAGKKKAVQQIKILIPKQKVGKLTIQETTMVRTGTVLKTGKGAYTVRTSEGAIIDIKPGKEIDIVLAGAKRGTGYYIEKAKVGRGEDVLRFYTGSAAETTGKVSLKDIKVATKLLAKGKPASRIGEVPRTDVKMAGTQDIQWLDIAKPAPGGVPATKPLVKGWPGAVPSKPTKGPTLSLKVTETPKPMVPTGKVSVVGPREALGLPTFTITATAAASATEVALKPAREARAKLAMAIDVKAERATKKRARMATVVRSEPVLKPATALKITQLELEKQDIEFVSRQIPGVDIDMPSAQKQVQVVKSKEAIKIPTKMAAPTIPVPVTPPPIITPTSPPPGLALLPGGLTLGQAMGKATTYRLRTIINPIAATLDIKIPKITGV